MSQAQPADAEVMMKTKPGPTQRPSGVVGSWGIAFLAAMVLYGTTASREIQWQDYGAFVLRIVTGELVNPLGLALTHPLHYWLGRAAVRWLPVEPPHAVALVSAAAGAVAVANLFGLVRHLTGCALAAALAAAGLGVAHTFWRLSTVPESYTITTALLTAELWALVRWDQTRRPGWLVLAFFANGVGLTNHNLALLTLPVLGVVLLAAVRRREARPAALGWAAVAWLAGASPYIAVVARHAAGTGDWGAAVHSALFGNYQAAVLSTSLPPRAAASSVAFTLLSFPNLILPAAVLGATRGRRAGVISRTIHRALLAALLIHTLFVLRYDVVDQYTFLLPTYAILAALAGAGFAVVRQTWPARSRAMTVSAAVASLALTPVMYLFAADVARSAGVLRGVARHKPYRDDYRYLFTPWGSGDRSAARMSRHAADLVAGPGDVIVVEDGMAAFAVRYELWRRGLTDVRLVARIEADQLRTLQATQRRAVLVPARTDRASAALPFGKWRISGELYFFDATDER